MSYSPSLISPNRGGRPSPIALHIVGPEIADSDEEYVTSPSFMLASAVPFSALDGVDESLNSELAMLESLRNDVRKNLSLRPLRSTSPVPPPTLNSYSPSNNHYSRRSPSPGIALASIAGRKQPSPQPQPHHPHPHRSQTDMPSRPQPLPLAPYALARSLRSISPLLLDTRPLSAFQSYHIKSSINLSIPSLILKRTRKPSGGGGFPSLDALRPFITTESGKAIWDTMIVDTSRWNGDVVVFDESMDESDPLAPSNSSSTTGSSSVAWTLAFALLPIVRGSVYFLKGGISAAPSGIVISGNESGSSDEEPRQNGAGLLKPGGPTGLSSLRPSSAPSSPRPSPRSADFMSTPTHPHSPLPPSPLPPGKPPRPKLRRLDTASHERLDIAHTAPAQAPPPKLQLRMAPLRSASLSPLTAPATSPPELMPRAQSPGAMRNGFSLPPSPSTARPSTPSPAPFEVSTILPSFLFLGSEPTSRAHIEELQNLGVKRILNVAIECDADDHGLALREVFDRYKRVPMRDHVEEQGVAKGVREVCEFLDDARLHSSPTYVHCKAGKSRSVTVVLAYLIHANHWPLSRAYSYVMERRTGISPNIGFVSELMNWEEQELGGKSTGVLDQQGPASAPVNDDDGDGDTVMSSNYSVGVGGRRAFHARESLPPPIHQNELSLLPTAQEVEIKDWEGRYRHARRAPVDETTLQPRRRVSKAGLESSNWG